MKKLYSILLVTIYLFTFSTFAEQQATFRLKPNEYEEKIRILNEENDELNLLRHKAPSHDRIALQMYMFRKNEEIRKLISEALDKDAMSESFLIEQINIQKQYTEQQIKFLSQRIATLVNELNKAKGEDKFAILNQYQEVRFYLNSSYKEQAQNLIWAKKLNLNTIQDESTFKRNVQSQLEQIAAGIEYLKHKRQNENQLLKETPEAERASLLLNLSITNKQINIITESLQVMMALADDLDIHTAQYKKLYFNVTGSVTQDLLNKDVLITIFDDWSAQLWKWITENTPKLLFKLLIVFIILYVTRLISKIVKKVIGQMVANKKLKFSHLMQDFFVSMSGNFVWIVGLLIALSQMGINLAPVLTGFGIASVIIGFALQDTLSNFAAGMMLLIYRPFDVGDFVYAGGVEGKVSHMSLVNTTIKTFDNQIIIVPNSKIWGDVIKNVTHERVRRVDMVFGVSYSDDIETVEKIFEDIITNHPAVLKSPEPMIKVGTLNSSSVDFLVRPWVKTDDYWDVYWDVTREVKIRFDKEGITIPFPQQDIHVYQGSEKAQYLNLDLNKK